MRNLNRCKHVDELAGLEGLDVCNVIGELKTLAQKHVAGCAIEVCGGSRGFRHLGGISNP